MSKDYGWICSECGNLNKHLELDLEFGKRRQTVECDSCGERVKLEEQEAVYRKSDLVEALKRQLDAAQADVSEAINEIESELAQQREKTVHEVASVLGFGEEVRTSEGVRKCVMCGYSNSAEADSCSSCGADSWKGEVISE